MIQRTALKLKKYPRAHIAVLAVVMALAAVGFSIYFEAAKTADAGLNTPSILIISNDDTYAPTNYTRGTSAAAMQTYLAAAPLNCNVTVVSETGSPNLVNASYASTADQYDLVIFTQGIGYRSTTNNKPGLDPNDLLFLKEYLNITNTSGGPHKAKLIIEGEDILYDMGLSGTSTDQLNILKINTSSSAGDRGRITQLKVLDTAHPVNAGLAASAPTSYQTVWQDALVATTGAKIITNGTISGKDYGAINTFDDGNGHRLVFMPFAWDANSSNLITDQTWREKLLLNAVKWVGERKVTVTAGNLAPAQVPPSSTEEMLDVTLTAAWGETATPGAVGTSGISGLKVTVTGSYSGNPAAAISNVIVYDDANNNGVIDAGDTELGRNGTFSGSTCTVNFNSPFALAAGSTKNLIVAYQLTGVTSGTVGTSLADNTALMIHPNDYLANTYGIETALSSAISSITTSGTVEILSPANNGTVGGITTVTGSTSGPYVLEFSPGFNSTGPWTEIINSTSTVTRGTLATWNTTGLTDGGYTLRLRLLSGGQAPLVNVTTDNTPPGITGLSAAVSTTSATVSWTTDEPATATVVYQKASGGSPASVNVTSSVTNHTVQLSGLESNTDYQYYVESTDAVGNKATSAQYSTFKTQQLGAYAKITSPAVMAEVLPRIGGIVDIIGTAKTDRVAGSVYWTVYLGSGTDPSLVSTWEPMQSLQTPVIDGTLYSWDTNTLDNGSYVLKLMVLDPGITGPTASMEDYVTVVVDNTPPIISNVHTLNISNVSAVVAWDVNKQAPGQVMWGTSSGVYPNIISDTDGDNKVFIQGLTRNTTYYYKVVVADTAGHNVSSGEYSFTTTDVTDTTPPLVDNVNLVATGRTDTTVDLAWNAGTDNTGISSYRIWRSTDGSSFVLAGTVSGDFYVYKDTGLNASTTYWYRLTALDLAGNESATPSNTVQVPTVAAFRVNPHGAYPKLTGMCVKCHHTHRGQKSMLFNNTQEQKVCYSCHNGTGSIYDIQSEYDPNVGWESRHPLPMSHTQKECASCHNPHLSASDTPRLLSAKNPDGTVVSSGPQFCLVCHGDNVVNKVVYEIGGSHQPFIGSVHDEQMAPPPSGTRVTCTNCHRNHSSLEVRLTKAKEEENCYQCHSSTGLDAPMYADKPPAYQTVLFSVYDDFQNASHHKISDTDQVDGSKVECVNCHNPHYITDDQAGNKKIISDPDNTNKTWLTGDSSMGRTSNFCIRCHDTNTNDPAKLPQQQVDDKTVVPYTVKFPSIPDQTKFTTNTGGWDKSGYTASQHFTLGVECTNCHDPHGTAFSWLTSYDEDPDSSPSPTSGICLRCHGGGATPAGPDVWTNGFSAATYKHPSLTTQDTHTNTETTQGMSRHAECVDCHDPHSATNAPGGSGAAGGELSNVLGVEPVYPGTNSSFLTAQSYQSVTVSKEYQLCFKCHSNYGYNNTFPTPFGGIQETDLAKEFNPVNVAYHNVGLPGAHTSTIGAGFQSGTGWTALSVLNCTSCHGADVGTAKINAGGSNSVHGSSNPYILKGAWNNTLKYSTSTSSNNLCLKCHNTPGGTGSRFPAHSKGDHDIACQYCHATVPHGGIRPGLLVIMSTSSYTGTYGYNASYDGVYGAQSRLYVKSWPTTSWSKSNCGCDGSGH